MPIARPGAEAEDEATGERSGSSRVRAESVVGNPGGVPYFGADVYESALDVAMATLHPESSANLEQQERRGVATFVPRHALATSAP